MSAVLPVPTSHALQRVWSASKATVYNDKVVRQFSMMAVVWGGGHDAGGCVHCGANGLA